jgi:hypothetical protein
MRKAAFALLGALCALSFLFSSLGSAQEQQLKHQTPPEQPQLHEEVTVRWWIVPVYALDKAGKPVLNLGPGDFDIYVKGLKVEQFTLHKKTFAVSETKEATTSKPKAAPLPAPAVPQKKMTFLVFDAASTTRAKLDRAKIICEGILARADVSSQYVLLSIEPHAGLHYYCGPTQDRHLIGPQLKELISGKKLEYLRTVALRMDWQLPIQGMSALRRADIQSKYQETIGFRYSIQTLSLIASYFPQFSKVVYLFSSRVPWDTFNDVSVPAGFGQNPIGNKDLDFVSAMAKALNKSGAFLITINPVNDIDLTPAEKWENGGKENLQSLASESGGRYIAGDEKQIIEQVSNLEGGYYEVSFPDKPEYEGQDLSLEIRSNRPGVELSSLRNVGRQRSFADMNDRERELLVLNILDNGPNALTTERVSYVEDSATREGETLVCRLTLPPDLARSQWDIYKVARNPETGDTHVDTESLVSESTNCDVKMKWRGAGYRYDIVLAHLKTGTILVAK